MKPPPVALDVAVDIIQLPHLSPAVRAVVVAALQPTTFCAETTELFDEFCADSRAKSLAHLERIESEAFRLGREVGSYGLTLADATARVERLLDLRHECTEPLRLVPLPVGRVAARTAFEAGMAAAKQVVA